MDRQTRTKMQAHIVNELQRLGALQKQLFNEGKGVGSKEYSEVLAAIRAFVSSIA
jgi:hypothetical protein